MKDNINIEPLDTDSFFNLDEFLITYDGDEYQPLDVPYYVLNNIIKYHLIPLNVIRKILNSPVIVSKASCFRPVFWEINKGRNGTSTHTFGTNTIPEKPKLYKAKGASDTTLSDMSRFVDFAELLARAPFRRHIIYPEKKFVHNDYNADNKHFLLSVDGELKHIRFEEYLEHAEDIAND